MDTLELSHDAALVEQYKKELLAELEPLMQTDGHGKEQLVEKLQQRLGYSDGKRSLKTLLDSFHIAFYGEAWREILSDDREHILRQAHNDPTWLGTSCQKMPFDLFVYQEIIWEQRPDLIIECGTSTGGTTLFLAAVCQLVNHGCVATIDKVSYRRAYHPLIGWWVGDTLSEEILTAARESAAGCSKVIVILDDDHEKHHVMAELDAYAPLVTMGSYLIVEDTNVNGHPVFPAHGAGPWEALEEWLPKHPEFAQDRTREHFGITYNPGGYLKRVG